MSLNETNYCGAQQDKMIIKKEAAKNVEFDDPWPISLKVKCENEQNVPSFDQSSELNNFEKTYSPFPVKHEPEDSKDDVQVQSENFELKEEEIDIEEHIPVWELTSGSSNVEIFKNEADLMQKNLSQPSESETNRCQREVRFNCKHCAYKTNKKSSYIRHYNRKHKQVAKIYKCNECSYETKTKYAVATHFQYKHSKYAPVYKCEECSYETRRKSCLTQHYICKHLKDADVYKCRECSFETRFIHYLTQNYKCKHSKDTEVYKCHECSYETEKKCAFTTHYKFKHAKKL